MQKLIYTEQRFFPQFFDRFVSFMAWVGFIYIIYRAMNISNKMDLLSDVSSVKIYTLVCLFNALALLLWAKYNQALWFLHPDHCPPEQEKKLSGPTGLIDNLMLPDIRNGKVMVFYNNENGELYKVESLREMTT